MSQDRDYIAEMNDRMTEAIGDWGTTSAIIAGKLHAQLLESDHDLLDGWLHAMAVDVLRRAIGLRSSAMRTKARRRAGSAAFRDAAAEFGETGDGARFTGMFGLDYVVDDKDTRKLVADMTGPEHLFVAEREYEQPAAHMKMLAAFHRAVAKKVGGRRTGDVLTEEQYAELYRSIVSRAA